MDRMHEFLFRLPSMDAKADECAPVLLLSDGGDGLPIPCPGIMRQKDIEHAMSGQARTSGAFAHAVVPFCPRTGHNMRMRVGTSACIRPMEPKNYVAGHRIEVVEKFNFKDIEGIQQMVVDRGAVSYIITGHKNMARTMRGIEKQLFSKFKHPQMMKYETNKNSRDGQGDELVLMLTFVELQYCIPIYNAKKIDGVGLYVFLTYPKSCERRDSFRYHSGFTMVLSQYPDNVLTVDGGSKLNGRNRYPDALTQHFLKAIEQDAKVSASEVKKKAAEPAPGPVVPPSPSAEAPKKKRSKKKLTTTFSSGGWSTSSTSSSSVGYVTTTGNTYK